MSKRESILLAAAFVLAACAVPTISEQQYLHSITVQPNGNLLPVRVDPKTAERVPENPKPTIETQLHWIHESEDFQKAERILVFVHGGLNSLEDGLERTARTAPCILWDSDGKTYPIFVNWNSDLAASYMDHLVDFRSGRQVQTFWGVVSSPFILLADIGRAISRLPIVAWSQGSTAARRLWRTERPKALPPGFEHWESRVRADERYEWSTWDNWSDGLTQVFPGVLRVVTSPLIDTMGFAGYDMIERRVDTLFHTNDDLRLRTKRPRGALFRLMESLDESKPIILVGHSMGTIVLNELIRQFPHHNYERIVYLAAACTIRDFLGAVPEYLHEHEQTEFFNVCLHPAADENEVTAWSMVPNGSLLVWLDAFVLGPRTRVWRTLGKWNNAINVINILNGLPVEAQHAIHMKAFPVVGRDYPHVHGAFDDFVFWDPRFADPTYTDPIETIESMRRRMEANPRR